MNAHRSRKRAGTSTLEFALVLPLLMLMLIGIVQYSFYFLTSASMQTLVAYAARSAAIQSEAGTLATAPTLGTLGAVTPALDPALVTLTVDQATVSGVTTVTASGSYAYSIPFLPVSVPISVTSQISYHNY